MKASELEDSVRRIITATKAGNPVEDSLIEIKSEWSKESIKAARRLAGHANAAKGEPIIWIFGVDEKAKTITGVAAFEMEQWTKAVSKHFDGEAPALVTHANIHIEDKTVVALYFETFRAVPFVVKSPEGGYPQFEVPWREGTRLRAAKREELLQILLPVVRVPHIQILNAELNLGVRSEGYSGSYVNQPKKIHVWTLKANLYITPKMNGRIFIPHKNCEVQFKIAGYAALSRLRVKFEPIGQSLTVRCSETELIIDGPGSVCLESKVTIPIQSSNESSLPEGQAKLLIKIRPNNSSKSIVIEKELKYVAEQDFFSNFFLNGSRWVS